MDADEIPTALGQLLSDQDKDSFLIVHCGNLISSHSRSRKEEMSDLRREMFLMDKAMPCEYQTS
jgi:hypothetical protein